MGPEEDIWLLPLAEVLGDPLLQGFILGFGGFLLLLISPSSQVATCCNCYKKGTWKGLQGPRCVPCHCRMSSLLVQGDGEIFSPGQNPMQDGLLQSPSLGSSFPASVQPG